MVQGGPAVQLGGIVVTVVGLWIGARLLVDAAVRLARRVGFSDVVIGLTIVAAGTSTPEFAVSLVAIRRGSLGVSVGNIVGSNIFNLLGIMGIAAVIRPLSVSPAAVTTLVWLLVVAGVLVGALWTGRTLSRIEGTILVGSEIIRWGLGLVGVFK